MRFVKFEELDAQFGIPGSKSTIWRKEAAKRFPRRCPVGARYIWPSPVIESYARAIARGMSEEDATIVAERAREEIGGAGD